MHFKIVLTVCLYLHRHFVLFLFSTKVDRSFIFASRIEHLPPFGAESCKDFVMVSYGTLIMSQADLHVPYFSSVPLGILQISWWQRWVFVLLYHQLSIWPILSGCLWTGLKCPLRQEGLISIRRKDCKFTFEYD